MSCTIKVVKVSRAAFRVTAPRPSTVVVVARATTGPPGLPGRDGAGSPAVEAENKSGSTIYAGQAVSQHSSGIGWELADAAAWSTRCYAVATETKGAAVSLAVQPDGVLELADWTAATGASSLPARSRWYLGAAGTLTQSPNQSGGHITQFVGEALSPQKMALRITAPIKRS